METVVESQELNKCLEITHEDWFDIVLDVIDREFAGLDEMINNWDDIGQFRFSVGVLSYTHQEAARWFQFLLLSAVSK